MDAAEYEKRLSWYHDQVMRLIEIDQARQAREDVTRAQIDALKVKAVHLERQLNKLRGKHG